MTRWQDLYQDLYNAHAAGAFGAVFFTLITLVTAIYSVRERKTEYSVYDLRLLYLGALVAAFCAALWASTSVPGH